jgi:C-terminal processing protease CtpA/Prc
MKKTIIILFLIISSSASSQEYNGTWESIGYGRFMTIKNDKFEILDFTNISCIPSMKGKLSELTDKINISEDTLAIRNGLNTYYFQRSTNYECNASATKNKAKDPIYNFEVLAETFKNHYAYFKERNIDWEKMYQKYRSRITEKTSQPELFIVIKEMLDEFGDEHIQFSAPDKIEEKAMELASNTSQDVIEKPKRIQSWKLAKEVAETVLDSVKSKNGGTVRWSILEGNIGYLQINQMIGLANYDIDANATVPEFWKAYIPIMSKKSVLELTNEEKNGISRLLDKIMPELKNTKGIIVDLRFNGGGKDEVGLEMLSRFTNEKLLIGTKKAVHNNGFSTEVPIFIEGKPNAYSNPICILTSRGSASATEICVLASLSMKNVTRIGGNTEGITSDMLEKTLPNGWEFSLSNEIYLGNNDKSYEYIGISPDIIIYDSDTRNEQYQTIQKGLENKKDLAIEKAIEILNG